MNWTWQWSKMAKEQKQIVILACMMAVGVLFAAYQFVLLPMVDRGRKEVEDLRALRTQLDQAAVILRNESKLSNDLVQVLADLERAQSEFVASVENPLSWVSEKVYRSSREVNVEIQSVQEMVSPPVPWARETLPGSKPSRLFIPYTVRIVMECSYADLIRLIEAIELSNPYLCISGMSISSQDPTPEKHSITLQIEWPMGSIQKAMMQRFREELPTQAPAAPAERAGAK
jgi:hypothetical protein